MATHPALFNRRTLFQAFYSISFEYGKLLANVVFLAQWLKANLRYPKQTLLALRIRQSAAHLPMYWYFPEPWERRVACRRPYLSGGPTSYNAFTKKEFHIWLKVNNAAIAKRKSRSRTSRRNLEVSFQMSRRLLKTSSIRNPKRAERNSRNHDSKLPIEAV